MVVSYWNSTSNHNFALWEFSRLFVVSYWNSTSNHNWRRCSTFGGFVVSYWNSTSNHNFCKPLKTNAKVVSYWNSTSNHNDGEVIAPELQLYLIEILHQTTTGCMQWRFSPGCILLKFYIKPQPLVRLLEFRVRCILLKFYIKPQHSQCHFVVLGVVSYWNSTSNHNTRQRRPWRWTVVSYWNSTSNHNWRSRTGWRGLCCILLKFYIKPQQFPRLVLFAVRCILLKFYIKPQLVRNYYSFSQCCILLKFYIKPQPWISLLSGSFVVSYWNSTSNHNLFAINCQRFSVVSYWNSTSNHNKHAYESA